MMRRASLAFALLVSLGCEVPASEWLEPVLSHATPSPFIALMVPGTLDEIMAPRWRIGDWWVIESCYWIYGDLGYNEWNCSEERYVVTALPKSDLDEYVIEIRTERSTWDLVTHALVIRRNPLSVAISARSVHIRDTDEGREYTGGATADKSGRHPFTPPFDFYWGRPFALPARAGMHRTYFARGTDIAYRQSVFAGERSVMFHAVPVERPANIYAHTFEWHRGDPWWSTYRRSLAVSPRSERRDAVTEEVVAVARLKSVAGKPTAHEMPERWPPPTDFRNDEIDE